MKKIIFISIFLMLALFVQAQEDRVSFRAGLMNIDVLGRTIGYNLECIYEKEILPKFSTEIALGIGNLNTFNDLFDPKHGYTADGVPTLVDKDIRSIFLNFGEILIYEYNHYNLNYLQTSLRYYFFIKFLKLSISPVAGFSINKIHYSKFYLKSYSTMNNYIISYGIRQKRADLLKLGWAIGFSIEKQIGRRLYANANFKFIPTFKPGNYDRVASILNFGISKTF